ncbi:MAG: amidohydrolase family protein [Chloroflexota bacterium]|nr:amidohydrolase family protein [Chloroflexota bacterium]|tara:strand:- start:773 stop:1603 length:831 start_codon:yes stop_codon:yes gene_type:complete
MNILDTHHHLWDLSLRSYDWITELPENESIKINRNFLINDLDVLADENNVTGTICVQAHQSEEEALWLLEIAKNSNLIKGVVCWVDLKNSNIGFSLDKYQTYDKFCGIRHVWHDEKNEDWIMDPKVIKGLKTLSERQINFDFLVRPNHLKYIFEVYEKIPKLNGVIDHIAKPIIKENIFEPWAENISELSKIDSLNCKISGMVEEMNESQEISILKNYTDHVIESFGHDKVMYGSNWPVCLTKKSYSEVLEIAKSISNNLEPEEFFYTNGKNFYLD